MIRVTIAEFSTGTYLYAMCAFILSSHHLSPHVELGLYRRCSCGCAKDTHLPDYKMQGCANGMGTCSECATCRIPFMHVWSLSLCARMPSHCPHMILSACVPTAALPLRSHGHACSPCCHYLMPFPNLARIRGACRWGAELTREPSHPPPGTPACTHTHPCTHGHTPVSAQLRTAQRMHHLPSIPIHPPHKLACDIYIYVIYSSYIRYMYFVQICHNQSSPGRLHKIQLHMVLIFLLHKSPLRAQAPPAMRAGLLVLSAGDHCAYAAPVCVLSPFVPLSFCPCDVCVPEHGGVCVYCVLLCCVVVLCVVLCREGCPPALNRIKILDAQGKQRPHHLHLRELPGREERHEEPHRPLPCAGCRPKP